MQNDQQIQKLNANISITSNVVDSSMKADPLNAYSLRIDSSNFDSNNLLDEGDLDVSSWLEIKYTNQTGVLNNQCNVFKIMLVIQFSQSVYFSLRDLINLDTRYFQMLLAIKNLSKSTILLKRSNNKNEQVIEVVKESSELEFQVDMIKIDITSLDQINGENVCCKINEHLNLSYALENEPNSLISLKFNRYSKQFNNFLSRIITCPINLKIERAITFESESGPKLHSLMLIASNLLNNASDTRFFQISWKIKSLNCSIISKDKTWEIRVNIK